MPYHSIHPPPTLITSLCFNVLSSICCSYTKTVNVYAKGGTEIDYENYMEERRRQNEVLDSDIIFKEKNCVC